MAMPPSARRAMISAAKAKIAKSLPDTASLTTWHSGIALHSNAVTSGILYYDLSIGIGGVPEKRMIMHHGPTACGKSTLKWLIIKSFQQHKACCITFDFERKDELDWAVRIGVKLEDDGEIVGLEIGKARDIESAFDAIEKFARELREAGWDGPILVSWDSFQSAGAKLTHDAGQLEGTFSPETRAYSRGLKILTPAIDDYGITVIGTSQVRANIGAMGNEKKTKVGVGNAVGHACVAIAELRLEQKLSGSKPCQFARGTWIKNQLSDPFGTFLLPIVYGRGVDVIWSDIECARVLGMLEVSGAWFEIDCGDEGTHRAQGIEKSIEMLTQHPNRLFGLREKARDFIGKKREVDLTAMERVGKFKSPEQAISDEDVGEDAPSRAAKTVVHEAGKDLGSANVVSSGDEEEPTPSRTKGRGRRASK